LYGPHLDYRVVSYYRYLDPAFWIKNRATIVPAVSLFEKISTNCWARTIRVASAKGSDHGDNFRGYRSTFRAASTLQPAADIRIPISRVRRYSRNFIWPQFCSWLWFISRAADWKHLQPLLHTCPIRMFSLCRQISLPTATITHAKFIQYLSISKSSAVTVPLCAVYIAIPSIDCSLVHLL
jgi:hypothetical protein